jgi:hypothetical protein
MRGLGRPPSGTETHLVFAEYPLEFLPDCPSS